MMVFQRLNRDLGITVIMITHEPPIANFARRRILFRDGRVVEDRENPSPLSAMAVLEET
jgi:putative ABC transport system ATP-binding protein